MAYEVVMPRLGWNMEAGSLVEWRKQEGEQVEAGEILFSVESDKVVQEVEALEGGILHIPPGSPLPGVTVPVGTQLAYLLKPGESLPIQDQPGASVLAPGAAPGVTTPAPTLVVKSGIPTRSTKEQPAVSPRAARVAAELGVDWTGLRGSGRTGRIIERDVRRAALAQAGGESLPGEVFASPVARRAAEELGIDLVRLAGQMPGRRIERADVELAAQRAMTEAASPAAPAAENPLPAETRLPVSQVRRLTAERMSAGIHTAAPVTLTSEMDATELVRLRKQLKEDNAQRVPSYVDLLAKITAFALLEHPYMNARFEGESILQSAAVNLSLAVDTERGLLAPVLRDVQAKSLLQIAQESAELIERARTGLIQPDDLHGGTFTITNLGMYEIDAFTPIINLPECAILGIGRVVPKQVVVDVEKEHVAIRHMLFLSLTFDHRLVDGAPAARFLQRIKQYVEKPYLWLVKSE